MHTFLIDLRFRLPVFSAILSVLMISYCLWKGRRTKLLYSYILLLMVIVLYFLAWVWDETVYRTQQYIQIKHISLLFDIAEIYMGYIWLLFFGLYTGSWLISKKRNLWLLLIPPSILLLARLTNDYHRLYYSFPTFQGKIFHGFTITLGYIYISIGIVMMIKYAVHQLKNSRSHSVLLIFSAIILLAGNLLDQLIPIELMAFSPAGLSLSVVLLGASSFNFRFLNIIPVGRKKIINRMKESMMIIDRADTVVNYNRSFKNNFPEFTQTKTDDLKIFTEQLSIRCDNDMESASIITVIKNGAEDDFSGELTLVTPEWKCFLVHVQSIFSKRGKIQGRIVLFNDITRNKKLLRELHDKNTTMLTMNQELAAANEQLKDYARTVEQLAVAQERNRIARDTHDTIGHTMAKVITLIQVSSILIQQDPQKAAKKLDEAVDIAQEGLLEVKRSIAGLAPGNLKKNNLKKALQNLFTDFISVGIKIDFSIDGPYIDYPVYSDVIYRACQEALTNAHRHGKAEVVTIILKFLPQQIKLYIFDDGVGCQDLNKGSGLTGMEQRVKEVGGNLNYGSGDEKGFNIYLEIPVCEII